MSVFDGTELMTCKIGSTYPLHVQLIRFLTAALQPFPHPSRFFHSLWISLHPTYRKAGHVKVMR